MDEELQSLISRLQGIRGFNEFMLTYTPESNGEKPIIAMLSKFREHRNNTVPLSKEEIWLLDFLQNKAFEICHRINSNRLYYLDESQTIGENILSEFRDDWENARTSRFAFKDKEKQTYVSWTETFLLKEYEDIGITRKYQDCYHPAIYSEIGRALINGGHYTDGIPFLISGIRYAINRNNPFWHTPHGIFGCAYCLWEFIRLLSIKTIKAKYNKYYLPLMKLLYLYLSRGIALARIKKLGQAIDFYRNRADLVRLDSKGRPFMSIFAECGFFATNMDIQFISDCYLGYKWCGELGSPELGEQMLWDSKKMYEYGSLNYLNEDNGYKDIEDATWLELVERGRVRSDKVAEHLIEEMEQGKLVIEFDTLQDMVVDLLNQHHNAPQRFNWHTDSDFEQNS